MKLRAGCRVAYSVDTKTVFAKVLTSNKKQTEIGIGRKDSNGMARVRVRTNVLYRAKNLKPKYKTKYDDKVITKRKGRYKKQIAFVPYEYVGLVTDWSMTLDQVLKKSNTSILHKIHNLSFYDFVSVCKELIYIVATHKTLDTISYYTTFNTCEVSSDRVVEAVYSYFFFDVLNPYLDSFIRTSLPKMASEYRRTGKMPYHETIMTSASYFPICVSRALPHSSPINIHGMTVVDIINPLKNFPSNISFFICKGDITNCTTDAIVNAANETCLGGGGVDGAIHRAAGPNLFFECMDLPLLQGNHTGVRCKTGSAVKTKGHALCPVIYHAVGPNFNHGSVRQNMLLLRSTYNTTIRMAIEDGITSIAFPFISSGIFSGQQLPIHIMAAGMDALMRSCTHEKERDMVVLFVCYDDKGVEDARLAARHIGVAGF